MRVSDSTLSDLLQRNLTERRESYFRAQQQASSGLRVAKPSDDPVAAGTARGLASRERRAAASASMAAESRDELIAVDSVLASAVDVMARARELAIQTGNDTMSASDRAAAAAEVGSLRDQMLALANTQLDGHYVFGGIASESAPYDAAGAFVGSTSVREIELGPGVRVATQVSGDVFSGVFATLDSLEVALNGDDGPTIRASLTDLTRGLDQLASGRTEAGTLQQNLQVVGSVAQRVADNAQARRSGLVDADTFDTLSRMMLAESALSQAVSLASRLPMPGLLQSGGG
ncbi:MAG: flagellar hook-associated protein FlgL [Sandaracinaceae bacterium]|nr:flagellar hook-associated protein FlgL [Sandaracinaceae bacterium]